MEFGRYAGVHGEVGFDGLWEAGDLAIVVEVKTTDVYAIKTATLLNYINQLVSAKRIDQALGLYVVGRLESLATVRPGARTFGLVTASASMPL